MYLKFKKIINIVIAVLRNFRYAHREYLKYGPIQRLSHGNYVLYKRISEHVLSFDNYCIVDVGASDGWFARIIYHFDKNAKIISFEPLTNPKILDGLKKVKTEYPKFEYYNNAIGDKKGTLELFEYGGTGLSSLKGIIDESYLLKGFDVSLVKKENVNIITLDSFFKNETQKIVLKIDTQGFEMEVLRGASDLFKKNMIDCIIIEISTIKKYEGQALFFEFVDFFEKNNFILFDVYPFFYENKGPLTEADYVFVNKKSKLFRNLYEK